MLLCITQGLTSTSSPYLERLKRSKGGFDSSGELLLPLRLNRVFVPPAARPAAAPIRPRRLTRCLVSGPVPIGLGAGLGRRHPAGHGSSLAGGSGRGGGLFAI